MIFSSIKRFLVGRPLHNRDMVHEKLPKWKAMAIFSSDALSSVAYGPEQIIIILTVPGLIAYGFMAPISLAILVLLAIITISYVQVARANPGGGGSYSVAKKNLGELFALTAAAALFADYSLTVAVSVSSGSDAIVSAFPALLPHEILIDLFVLFGVLMVINLRGVRESSTAFVFPTYGFIAGILALVALGSYKALLGEAPAIPPQSLEVQWGSAVLFLILRAFASGCSSMTGIEAISNGVPTLKAPEVRNARITTYWLSIILGVMFAGISFLMMHYHILPMENVTALSRIAEITVGRGWFYFYIQITTMLVLYLAANTSFNGLPPLLSILAQDRYMPRYLSARGDRLGFSNGIILLSIIAAIFIIIYRGNTDHLISLYAIGVFLSFTIAQTGMVIHWRREKGKGWTLRAALNGVGAVVTGIVVLIVTVTKFKYGAWVILLFIPVMIYFFKRIHSHYQNIRQELSLPAGIHEIISTAPFSGKNTIVLPVAGVTRVVANTITFAKTLGTNIIAIHVATNEESGIKVKEKWNRWNPGVELIVINSPYRSIIYPFIKYLDKLEKSKGPGDYITVLIPEFETKKWWHRILHNQTGWILRTILILQKNAVICIVPYHLRK